MFWNQKIECMEKSELENLQLSRLKDLVKLLYEKIPHYRKKFDEMGLKPEDLKTLEDLKNFPFTTKQDMRDNYPYGLFAKDLDQVVRLHASSGTTGKPVVVGYTERDIKVWTEMMSRALTCAGADEHSIIQNFHGYGLFTGGLGVHYGIENIGATAVPTSTGNTEKQIMLMKDLGTTFIGGTPSYAIYLADSLEKYGVKKEDLKLKNGVFGGEPWSDGMRNEIEDKFGIKAYNLYGLSELYGPSVGIECQEQNGLHIWQDLFIVEIIDPDTLERVPDGEYGELVITPLIKEALPLLRYRTRDITRIIPEKCSCGRTHVKIDALKGRSDDMLIVKGVNLFPGQIEAAILSTDGASPHYQITVDRKNQLDSLDVEVELDPNFKTDDIRMIERVRKGVQAQISSIVGIKANVIIKEPNTLPRFEGKSKRVIDKRKF